MDASRRTGTLALALLAVALCAGLAPLQSLIWNGAEAPAWIRGLGGLLPGAISAQPASSTLAQPTSAYFALGRPFILVYAALLGALLREGGERRAPRTLIVLLAIAAVGDVLAYWISASLGPSVRALGFWYVEVPALAAALVVVSAEGVTALRRRSGSLAANAIFALVIPIALLCTASLRYLPHGLVLALALVIAVHAALERRATLRGRVT